MSTATLPSAARQNVALFTTAAFQNVPGFKMYRQTRQHAADKGGGSYDVLVIENMPVFRAGTFRDSMGYQHTWDDIHMSQMVDHFDLLSKRGVLENVPIRKGHPGFFTSGAEIQDSLIGYHTALRTERMVNPVDGKEYNYLLADYEILDPDAIVKVERGLWRNMSAEVGTWVTNDEAEYWPVYQGVAYVDFSAVEGLKNFASANGVGSKYSIMSEESSVGDTTPVPTPPAGVPIPPAPAAQPAPAPAPAPAQHAAPAQPASAPAPSFQFTLGNGQTTTDFAAVQAELTALNEFRKGAIESGRKMFAKSLVDSGKMLASDLTKAEEYCLSLTDEQFSAYKALMESVPTSPVFAGQGVQGTSNHGATQPAGSAPAGGEFEIELETINQFRLSGMNDEQIKATGTYAKLAKAGKAPF